MKYILFVIWLCGFVLAQEQQAIHDTVIALDALNVLKNKTFSAGHTIQDFDTESQQFKTSTTVGQALSRTTSIPFRQFGNGMLMSISTRGLSPTHTGIYWEGLPLNSNLNGQVDLNLYGTQTFDGISFRNGGGSALFGSGAIGGSLHFTNKKKYNQNFKGNLVQTVGSFGLSNTSVQGSWGNQNWYVDGRFQYLYADNNYEYTALSGNQREIENGRIRLGNYSAQIGHKINDKNELKFSMWNGFANRNLPERRTAPSNQNQKDKNTRFSLTYENKGNRYKNTLQVGFLEEDFEYLLDRDFAEPSENATQSWLARYDFYYNLGNGWKVNTGAFANFAEADGDNVIDASRTDWNFFGSVNKRYGEKLNASFTIHKGISTLYDIPFTVDAGLDYQLIKGHTIKTNFTTNYRTPTFNDLFWQGQGNPDLQPEESWMVDLGYEFKKEWWLDSKLITTAFYGNFTNWIQWLPDESTGIFRPINIFEVENYGVESSLELKKKLSDWELNLNASYQYVKAERQDTQAQLIYTPEHGFNGVFSISYKKYGTLFELNQTGKSYDSSDETTFIDGFTLANLSFFTDLKLSSFPIFIQFSIQNLFNEEYETIRTYAMPGRHYRATFQIQI